MSENSRSQIVFRTDILPLLKLPYSSNISHKSRLQTLKLIPICYWHELLDVTFFSKLTPGLVNVNCSVLRDVRKYGRRTRSSTSNVGKYIIKKRKTTTYQKPFLIRTSRIWLFLADELNLSPSTLASFKSAIFNYYKSVLAVFYDCEDPRSFKSICLRYTSARPLSCPITCFIVWPSLFSPRDWSICGL